MDSLLWSRTWKNHTIKNKTVLASTAIIAYHCISLHIIAYHCISLHIIAANTCNYSVMFGSTFKQFDLALELPLSNPAVVSVDSRWTFTSSELLPLWMALQLAHGWQLFELFAAPQYVGSCLRKRQSAAQHMQLVLWYMFYYFFEDLKKWKTTIRTTSHWVLRCLEPSGCGLGGCGPNKQQDLPHGAWRSDKLQYNTQIFAYKLRYYINSHKVMYIYMCVFMFLIYGTVYFWKEEPIFIVISLCVFPIL